MASGAVERMIMSWRAIVTALALLMTWQLATCATQELAERHYGKKVEKLLASNDSLVTENRVLHTLASQDSARADSLAQSADSLRKTNRERIRIVRETYPATTASDSARDVVIDSLVTESRRYQNAYNAQLEATASFRQIARNTEIANESLARALEDRPKPKAPRASVGVFVGPCATQTGAYPFCAGVGVSWRIL
jgi:hypothetical protein